MGSPLKSALWFVATVALLLTLFSAFRLRTTSAQAATVHPQPTAFGLEDPDRTCAACHQAIYNSYEQTSMARDSGVASEAVHKGSFTSSHSDVTYSVTDKNRELVLTSRREDARAPLDDTEQLVYYIGSGLHGRTYLFRRDLPGTVSALWYEAPINWYTHRSAYGMAPAYENAANAPLAMPTEPNCLHCHATNVAEPVDDTPDRFHGAPFRQGGVGCSACHGDASAHVASSGKSPVLKLSKLTPHLQESICLQCHLEGDALVQRSGRSLARFLPGENLDDTAVYFVNASSPKTQERASSQYEGLLRSACRRAVGDRLTCTTCHDPHSEPAPAERVGYFRAKCLQCHTESASFHPATHHPEQPDCAHCHMPSRTTSDIAHEQNVDHNIEVPAGAAKPTANEVLRYSNAVDLVPVGPVNPTDRELGLAYAQFAERGDRDSFRKAVGLLAKVESSGQADNLVHQQLGYLLQLDQQNTAAVREYQAALAQQPHDNTAAANLAVLQAQRGDSTDAIRLLEGVSENAPDRTAALLDLAMLQCKSNQSAAAKTTLNRALHFQPDSFEARAFLATGDYSGMHCQVF